MVIAGIYKLLILPPYCLVELEPKKSTSLSTSCNKMIFVNVAKKAFLRGFPEETDWISEIVAVLYSLAAARLQGFYTRSLLILEKKTSNLILAYSTRKILVITTFEAFC